MDDWQPLNSSNVAACAYDTERQQLKIRFHSGRTYTYDSVPQSTYDGLLQADSPGKFVNSNVIGVYSFV